VSVFLQPIYTQTVGSGGASSITFNNIPQTFTDLKIVVSTRMNNASTLGYTTIRFNGDTASTLYSYTYLDANLGGGPSSSRSSGNPWFLNVPGASSTTNTFSNSEVYIPNYTSSNYKQGILDTTGENNATSGAWLTEYASLYRSTSPITSITLNDLFNSASFVQYSTFSLYGVLRQGV